MNAAWLVRAIVLLAVSMAIPIAAQADPLFAVMGNGIAGIVPGCSYEASGAAPVTGGGGPACDVTIDPVGGTMVISVADRSSADYTSLRVLSQWSVFVDEPATGRYSGGALAQYSDTLTIEGGTGQGTLLFDIALSGSTNIGGTGTPPGTSPFRQNASLTLTANGVQVTNDQPTGTIAASIPFTFGDPFSFVFTLLLEQQFIGSEYPGTHTSTIDYFNTALLQPFLVLDASSARVGSASVMASDGFSFPMARPTDGGPDPAPAPVPEPGTWLLVGSGLAFGRRAWRRRVS